MKVVSLTVVCIGTSVAHSYNTCVSFGSAYSTSLLIENSAVCGETIKLPSAKTRN